MHSSFRSLPLYASVISASCSMQSLSASGVFFRIRRRMAARCAFVYASRPSLAPTGRSTKKVHGRRRKKALSMSHGRLLRVTPTIQKHVAPTTTMPYLLSTSSESMPSQSCRNSDFICALASWLSWPRELQEDVHLVDEQDARRQLAAHGEQRAG